MRTQTLLNSTGTLTDLTAGHRFDLANRRPVMPGDMPQVAKRANSGATKKQSKRIKGK